MFHIARMDLGPYPTLIPRIPLNRGKSECPYTKRVCFAPTPEQCVIGIVGFGLNKYRTFVASFFELAHEERCATLYYTDEDLYEPDPIGDFHITQEHWALDPITVERIGYLDCPSLITERRVEILEHPVYVDRVTVDSLVKVIPFDDKNFILQELNRSYSY